MHLPSPECPPSRRSLPNELLHELVQCLPMSITSFERRIQLRVAFKNMALGVYIESAIKKAEERRRNALRELAQRPLKHWLNKHHKNPYPTKAEKTMLAIITKMTMTEVSTWFANARRQLKNENKMTWSPRNLPNDD